MAATSELIAAHLERSFAAQGVRVTNVEVSDSYSAKTLDVTFTTDPDPLSPIPEPAPSYRTPHSGDEPF